MNSLQLTRVTRWGGMISTPDSVLQTVIKRALIESGCPAQIVTELIENSHERRWPPGLSTLEARQLNRRVYENYICKRIPGKHTDDVFSAIGDIVRNIISSSSRIISIHRGWPKKLSPYWFMNKLY